MKFSCTQQNLQKGLFVVSKAISGRGSLPILANVLLTTAKGRLKLVTTDLEIAISTYVGAKVDAEGATTVPVKLFSEFVLTNSDPTLSIEAADHVLKISSQRHSANIKGLGAEEFPLIPEVKKENSFSLPAITLKEVIEKVAFAAASDETRPILTGVMMAGQKNQLTLVATDSYRLAEKTLRLPKPVEKDFAVVVPARAINELARVIDETIDMADVVIGENQIQFNFGATQIVSRLLEGKFPDYKPIIPAKTLTKATLQTSQFFDAIKMASFFAREVANNIKIKVSPNHIEVAAVSPQLGDAISRLKAQAKGENLEVAFNAKFLADGLQAIRQDEVLLELSGVLSPGILRPTKEEGYLYIVMPLKLEE